MEESTELVEAHGYLVVFAADSRESFVVAEELLQEIAKQRTLGTAVALVENKLDLERARQVEKAGARPHALAHNNDVLYCTSPLTQHVLVQYGS